MSRSSRYSRSAWASGGFVPRAAPSPPPSRAPGGPPSSAPMIAPRTATPDEESGLRTLFGIPLGHDESLTIKPPSLQSSISEYGTTLTSRGAMRPAQGIPQGASVAQHLIRNRNLPRCGGGSSTPTSSVGISSVSRHRAYRQRTLARVRPSADTRPSSCGRSRRATRQQRRRSIGAGLAGDATNRQCASSPRHGDSADRPFAPYAGYRNIR